MKRIVKGIAVLLVLLMTAFPALGEIERISEEKIPITVAGQTDTTLDYKNTFVTKWVEDNLGFDFTFTMYSKDVIATQFTLMLADNTLPDLIIDFDWNKSEINTYGEEGYFLDMSQYLDVMPNFNAFCVSHPDFAAYTRTSDGKIYSVNRCRDTVASRQLSQNWISKAWLERVGKEAPATLDELYELLVAFKEQDANGNGDPNDEIPMALTMDGQSGQRMEWMLKTAFGIYSVVIAVAFIRCPYCGRFVGRSRGKYCPHCGLSTDPTLINPEMSIHPELLAKILQIIQEQQKQDNSDNAGGKK